MRSYPDMIKCPTGSINKIKWKIKSKRLVIIQLIVIVRINKGKPLPFFLIAFGWSGELFLMSHRICVWRKMRSNLRWCCSWGPSCSHPLHQSMEGLSLFPGGRGTLSCCCPSWSLVRTLLLAQREQRRYIPVLCRAERDVMKRGNVPDGISPHILLKVLCYAMCNLSLF